MPSLWLVVLAAAVSAPPPDDLRAERDAIRAKESRALDDLDGRLGGEAMAAIRAMRDRPPSPDGSTRFVPLGEVIPRRKPVAPPELNAVRLDAAKALFEVASKALKAVPPRLALADACLRDVVARDPGHAEAHRLLGYVPHEGGWATPFAVQKRAAGFVLHPTFGWVEADWTPHLDRGELPAPFAAGKPTRWLPMAEADALRRDFARGWQIRTEHFAVLTNVPLSEAIAFGRHLEAFHELFNAIMADVIGPDLPLARLAKGARPATRKPHRVFYFGDKEQYVQYLLPLQGEGVRDTLGVFLTAKELRSKDGGASFFYRDPGGQLDATATLFHEVSHQLLFEMTPGKYDPDRQNFWVFEGLGTYFETLRSEPDGAIRVGGLVGPRIAVARKRLLDDGEFIPIGRLTTYNKALFNGDSGGDVYLKYAEAMALAVFFMQAHDARYRDPFLDYARDAYKGRLKVGSGKTLEDRLGVSYGLLARDFLAYLRPRGDDDKHAAGGR